MASQRLHTADPEALAPGTPEASASPLLSVMARPRRAALRLDARRGGGQPLDAGKAAGTAREERPLAEACGGEGGANMACGLPLHSTCPVSFRICSFAYRRFRLNLRLG
jgi:hypothetical protein